MSHYFKNILDLDSCPPKIRMGKSYYLWPGSQKSKKEGKMV